jgi:glutathione synthase/RimK-type ligase-like ATP-grasp enzyme
MRIGYLTSVGTVQRDRELEPFLEACEAAGLEAMPVMWDEAHPIPQLDAIVVRSVWNYPNDLRRFLAVLRQTRYAQDGGAVPRLVNDERIVRWNIHKRYLLELAECGVAVVPTELATSPDHCLALAARHDNIVIKPAVGSGAMGCTRLLGWTPSQLYGAYEVAAKIWKEVIVQPYFDNVETSGELSVIAVTGAAFRAIQKVPAPGEWRVQREYGGRIQSIDTTVQLEVAIELCLSIVERRCGTRPAYLRVDFLTEPNGRLLVSEVEMIEPVLYSDIYPDIAQALVEAVARDSP